MADPVTVILFHEAGNDVAGLVAAYHEVSRGLAHVPGLIDNELLESTTQDGRYLVVSRWADQAAFDRWEQGTDHRGSTAPLRRFRSSPPSSPFGVFIRRARYTAVGEDRPGHRSVSGCGNGRSADVETSSTIRGRV